MTARCLSWDLALTFGDVWQFRRFWHLRQSFPYKSHNFICHVRWGLDAKDRFAGDSVHGDRLPFGAAVRLMEDYGVGTVEKLAGGILEVFGFSIEHAEVKIGFQEADHAVGFHDHVLGPGDFSFDVRHGLSQTPLAGADPQRTLGARDQEP